MAIQKSKTLPNGAVGNYWRFMDVHINRQTLRVTATLALFKDKATSDAGKPPLGGRKTFVFSPTLTEISTMTNPVAWAYGKVMTIASATVTHDVLGNVLEEPQAYDEDLAGGETV